MDSLVARQKRANGDEMGGVSLWPALALTPALSASGRGNILAGKGVFLGIVQKLSCNPAALPPS